MKQLLGVVMCGGESRRMGTDKGLIKADNMTWAELALKKIKALQLPALVSINKTQKHNYGQLFTAEELVIDDRNVQGPLNGILSVHHHNPETDLLILACDMTDMKPTTLQQLIDTYQSEPGFDFYAYHNGQFFEPMCGIYTSAGLNAIMHDLDPETLHNLSLQNVLHHNNTKRLQTANDGSFKNVNSK
jgi:molybdopterin-guanine dinucleotide biosynthesis protein A